MAKRSDEAAEADNAEMAELELMADEAILSCGGDAREAVKALIVANGFLENEMSKVSYGYARRALQGREAG